jgi:hypothetical protein
MAWSPMGRVERRARPRPHVPREEKVSLPIYIAGGSSEIELCSDMIEAVTRAGGRVTYDWTLCPGLRMGLPLDMSERAEIAARDLAAVAEARLFWYIMPREKSEGAATELGAALTLRALADGYGRVGPHVIVSGPMLDSRLFPARADRIFAEHGEALAYVVRRCA